MTAVLAWHFLRGPLPGVLRDRRPAPAYGEILRHDGPLVLCEQGLHASVRPIDALRHAPGPIVCRVECSGTIQHGGDKLVCTERRILWRADADATLRAFARWCALSVIHLWKASPPQVVREYLETGREEIRTAAEAAAWAAAWAARASSRAAAWAARAAAWAASGAARAAGAAGAAAEDAAWAAVWAARTAAEDAAWAARAAKEAAGDAWNVRLEEVLLALAPAGGAQ